MKRAVSRLREKSGVTALRHAFALRPARAMSRRYGGAFDVTVQPLWQVFRDTQEKGVLPEPSAVEAARTLVNWRDLEISASCIRMRRAGMAVTLNGIAQGFAADKVMETLRAAGVQHALADPGGCAIHGRVCPRSGERFETSVTSQT